MKALATWNEFQQQSIRPVSWDEDSVKWLRAADIAMMTCSTVHSAPVCTTSTTTAAAAAAECSMHQASATTN